MIEKKECIIIDKKQNMIFTYRLVNCNLCTLIVRKL